MEARSRIYFPLRSNVGWFQTLDLKNAMERRIKEAILLYDELVIEDGMYKSVVTENGSFSPYIPPRHLKPDERRINFEKFDENAEAKLMVGPHRQEPNQVLISGKTLAHYQIDYYEIFHALEVSKYPYLKFVTINKDRFSNEAKALIKENVEEDIAFLRETEMPWAMQKQVAEGINYDLVTSMYIDAVINFDDLHSRLITRKATLPKTIPVKEQVAEKKIIEISVPDFDKLSIQECMDLRNEPSWAGFRAFISGVTHDNKMNPSMMHDFEAFSGLISTSIDKALIDEIRNNSMNERSTVLDLFFGAMSLIPGVGIASTIASSSKTVHDYYSKKSGWIAFINRLNEKTKT